jgi:hypothetical protein
LRTSYPVRYGPRLPRQSDGAVATCFSIHTVCLGHKATCCTDGIQCTTIHVLVRTSQALGTRSYTSPANHTSPAHLTSSRRPDIGIPCPIFLVQAPSSILVRRMIIVFPTSRPQNHSAILHRSRQVASSNCLCPRCIPEARIYLWAPNHRGGDTPGL